MCSESRLRSALSQMPEPHEQTAPVERDTAALDPQQPVDVPSAAASLTTLALANPALYGHTLGNLILAGVLGASPLQSQPKVTGR